MESSQFVAWEFLVTFAADDGGPIALAGNVGRGFRLCKVDGRVTRICLGCHRSRVRVWAVGKHDA